MNQYIRQQAAIFVFADGDITGNCYTLIGMQPKTGYNITVNFYIPCPKIQFSKPRISTLKPPTLAAADNIRYPTHTGRPAIGEVTGR